MTEHAGYNECDSKEHRAAAVPPRDLPRIRATVTRHLLHLRRHHGSTVSTHTCDNNRTKRLARSKRMLATCASACYRGDKRKTLRRSNLWSLPSDNDSRRVCLRSPPMVPPERRVLRGPIDREQPWVATTAPGQVIGYRTVRVGRPGTPISTRYRHRDHARQGIGAEPVHEHACEWATNREGHAHQCLYLRQCAVECAVPPAARI